MRQQMIKRKKKTCFFKKLDQVNNQKRKHKSKKNKSQYTDRLQKESKKRGHNNKSSR